MRQERWPRRKTGAVAFSRSAAGRLHGGRCGKGVARQRLAIGLRPVPRSGFYAPRGTPREIILTLNKDIIAAGTSPETSAKLDALGGSRDFTTPEEFAAFTASELEAWRKVIRAADIRAE
jgi:hypothetical protein